MSLPESVSIIYCQRCGAGWDKEKAEAMYYFKPRPTGDLASPQSIDTLDQTITNCPKCPLPIDEDMKYGDDRSADLR